MDTSLIEMHRLHREILSMDADRRYILQPALDDVISRLRGTGAVVPRNIAELNTVLIDEAIEAQFDNLPV